MKLPDEVRLVIKAVVFGTSAEDETTENRIIMAIEHYGSHSRSSGASAGRPCFYAFLLFSELSPDYFQQSPEEFRPYSGAG